MDWWGKEDLERMGSVDRVSGKYMNKELWSMLAD